VKQLDSSPSNDYGADWQTLGELKVRAGSHIEGSIATWLTQTLRPLDLPTDLASKILRSAHETAARALDVRDDSLGYGQVYLVAFAPSNHRDGRQTWGFFRLEKLEASPTGGSLPDHSIELYLYLDGKSD
jgi:hypothetical protein